MIKVVYDACVLYSAALRDLLMNIAVGRLAQPHWSDDIHEEWIGSLLHKRPDLQRKSLERTRRSMNESLHGGLVAGYEHIIPRLHLPDPDDRHVLALAVHVGASLIVTYNLADFPHASLMAYGVEAISPDDYISRLIEENAEGVLHVISKHRQSLTRPAITVEEYLDTLEKQRLPKTVTFLREHCDEI